MASGKALDRMMVNRMMEAEEIGAGMTSIDDAVDGMDGLGDSNKPSGKQGDSRPVGMPFSTEEGAAVNDADYFRRFFVVPARAGMKSEEKERHAAVLDQLREEMIDYLGDYMGIGAYTRSVAKTIAALPMAEGSTIRGHTRRTMNAIRRQTEQHPYLFSTHALAYLSQAEAPARSRLDGKEYHSGDILVNLVFAATAFATGVTNGKSRGEVFRRIGISYQQDALFTNALRAAASESERRYEPRQQYLI